MKACSKIGGLAVVVLAGCSGKIINYEPVGGDGGGTTGTDGGSPAMSVGPGNGADASISPASCTPYCQGGYDIYQCAAACQCTSECPCIDACLTQTNGCSADCPHFDGGTPGGDAAFVGAAESALATCGTMNAGTVAVANVAQLSMLLDRQWLFCSPFDTNPFAVGLELAGGNFYYLFLDAGRQLVRGTAATTEGTTSITQQGPGQFQLTLTDDTGGMSLTSGSGSSNGGPVATASGGEYITFTPSFQDSPRQLWLARAAEPGMQAPNAVVLVPAP